MFNVTNLMMQDLNDGVTAACPNNGVYIGNASDKATWGFHPAQGATQQQITAGQAVITNFDLAAYKSPNGSIYLLETCYENRRNAYQATGDQMDSLMKGLDAIKDTITLPQQTLDWIAACKAVKTQYPKP